MPGDIIETVWGGEIAVRPDHLKQVIQEDTNDEGSGSDVRRIVGTSLGTYSMEGDIRDSLRRKGRLANL